MGSEKKGGSNRVLILGGGRGGSAMLDMLLSDQLAEVVGIADINEHAPAMQMARERRIPIFLDVEEAVRTCAPCLTFNLTGEECVAEKARSVQGKNSVVSGLAALLIWRMVTQLQSAKARLTHDAQHDALTGIKNRRYMQMQLREGIREALRYGFPYSIVMLDLDHFKEVNDVHGHAAGDTVLKEVSVILRRYMRSTDHLGRWGGEEFLILLPHTSKVRAVRAAQKWLQAVRDSHPNLGNGYREMVTFSAGVAEFNCTWEPGNPEAIINHLLAKADRRMYEAKEVGRNCVMPTVTDGADCDG